MKTIGMTLLLAVTAASQTQLFNGSVAIPASNVWRVPFHVTTGGVVAGGFRAHGGVQNDIEVFIIPSNEYENLRNGNQFRYAYASGVRTTDNINVRLGPGYYTLVFSNRRGWVSRTVDGRVDLYEDRPSVPTTEYSTVSRRPSRACTLGNSARIPLYQQAYGGEISYIARGTVIELMPEKISTKKRGLLVKVGLGDNLYWARSRNVRC